jgi:hypothetical protein
MKIEECRDGLGAALAKTRKTAYNRTPLAREASAIAEMAEAYQKDGAVFFNKGDLVNALAACWYGSGWLHFGQSSGFLVSGSENRFCPFAGSSETLPSFLTEKLREKTYRYERLLSTARLSVECAAESATISNDFSRDVLFIVSRYAAQGLTYRETGKYEDALSCFSYGHGWLDAGVTCGFFRILDHREIFTV